MKKFFTFLLLFVLTFQVANASIIAPIVPQYWEENSELLTPMEPYGYGAIGSALSRVSAIYADLVDTTSAVIGTITLGFTEGSVPFIDASGNLVQDNANFFFDDGNDRLGIGTATPSYTLDVDGTLRSTGAGLFDTTLDVTGVTTVGTLTDGTASLTGGALTTAGIDMSNNTLTGTKAEFDTALSDGNFAYDGGAFHDGFSDYVANEHIDWTNTSENLLTTGTSTINGGAVFNEDGTDVDFRVESDTLVDALFVQGSDGFVGIGIDTPAYNLEISRFSDGADVGMRFSNTALAGSVDETNSLVSSTANEPNGKIIFTRRQDYSANAEEDSGIEMYTTLDGTDTKRFSLDEYGQMELWTDTASYPTSFTDGTVTFGSYIDATGGWYGTFSTHNLNFFTDNGGGTMSILANGKIEMYDDFTLHDSFMIIDGDSAGVDGLWIRESDHSSRNAIIATGYANGGKLQVLMGNSAENELNGTGGDSFLNASGANVGIGTKVPSYTLDINGDFRTVGLSYFDDDVTITAGDLIIVDINAGIDLKATASGNKRNSIKFLDKDDNDMWSIHSDIDGNNGQTFGIHDEIADVNRFAIDATGQVGINDSIPSYMLDVNGTFRSTGAGLFDTTLDVSQGFGMLGAGVNGRIAFSGTHGGGDEGITYEDSGGVGRSSLWFPGSDIVSLSNRASNGVVEIRANNATAGSGGEVVSATFEDTGVDIVGNLTVGSLTTPYQQIVTVCKAGADYDVIQDAIDSIVDATTSKRYRINICPGVYTENVVMKNWIILSGANRETIIKADSGIALTLPDEFTYVEFLVVSMNPTASGAVGISGTSGTGAYDMFSVLVEMESSTNGITGKLIDIVADEWIFTNGELDYEMTGSAVGSNTHLPIDINGSTDSIMGTSTFVSTLGDVDDDLTMYNNTSTGLNILDDVSVVGTVLNASYSGIFSGTSMFSTGTLTSMTNVVALIAGNGAGTGYMVFVDSDTNDFAGDIGGSNIRVLGFENNYYANAGTGDTINSFFSNIIASDGNTGDGDINQLDRVNDEFAMLGTARVTKEVRVDVSRIFVGGGITPPAQEIFPIGASGNAIITTLAFDPTGSGDEEIPLDIHIAEDTDDSVDIDFAIVWVPDPSWTSGDYRWSFEYLVLDEDGDMTAGASTIIFEDVTPANATDSIETVFASTISASPYQTISGRLYLDKSESSADDDGHLRFVELEYTANKLGRETN